MKKIILLLAALAIGYLVALRQGGSEAPMAVATPVQSSSAGDAIFAEAFERRQSDVRVTGAGVVSRVLSDDNDGSRHQRFLLQLSSGQTLMVAHNIDLADRVQALSAGDAVEFSGEYVWNEKGGLIHWTHRDPQGRHAGGWIRHAGRIYQ